MQWNPTSMGIDQRHQCQVRVWVPVSGARCRGQECQASGLVTRHSSLVRLLWGFTLIELMVVITLHFGCCTLFRHAHVSSIFAVVHSRSSCYLGMTCSISIDQPIYYQQAQRPPLPLMNW